jgi:hypothetical protein
VVKKYKKKSKELEKLKPRKNNEKEK